MKIKVIAFDLDDTLLDTTSLLLPIAGLPSFFERIAQPLPWMTGAEDLVRRLKKKYRLALVTQGDPKVQQQKVKSIGLQDHFEKIYYVNSAAGEIKKNSFQSILTDFRVSPDELLSIGNRRSTDIKWAKILGAHTCLFNYGEHRHEEASSEDEIPEFEIDRLEDLEHKCRL